MWTCGTSFTETMVVAVIDAACLVAIKSHQMTTITLQLYKIMNFLFCNYGRVTLSKLADDKQQLLACSFDPTLPSVLFYNKIDDLMDLANAAGSPYSSQQVINLGYILLNKTGKFTTGIHKWNRIPQAQRTCDAFQMHFSQAHL